MPDLRLPGNFLSFSRNWENGARPVLFTPWEIGARLRFTWGFFVNFALIVLQATKIAKERARKLCSH